VTEKTFSAGGVIINTSGDIVLVRQVGTSLWGFPKGHIEPGEDELEAAKREIHEETGISVEDLEFVKTLGTYSRYKIASDGYEDTSEWKTMTLFVFRSNVEHLDPIDPDNAEARWVRFEETRALMILPDWEFLMNVKEKIFS